MNEICYQILLNIFRDLGNQNGGISASIKVCLACTSFVEMSQYVTVWECW